MRDWSVPAPVNPGTLQTPTRSPRTSTALTSETLSLPPPQNEPAQGMMPWAAVTVISRRPSTSPIPAVKKTLTGQRATRFQDRYLRSPRRAIVVR